MIPSTTALRRVALAVAFAPALFARAAIAQNSQVALTDAPRRFMSPNLEAFEARRKAGIGQFITDSTLRAASGNRLSRVLQMHIPGMGFGSNNLAAEFPVSSRVCGGLTCAAPRCYVRIVIDGMLVFDGSPSNRDVQGIDISQYKPEDFSGIEYHASAGGLPAQYSGHNADCGTLLLWSRET